MLCGRLAAVFGDRPAACCIRAAGRCSLGNGFFIGYRIGDRRRNGRGRFLCCGFLPVPVPDAQRCQKRTHADTGCAEVIDFIDFQACVNLVRAGENIIYLIGCDRIQTAAEGIQLNHVEVITGFDEGSRAVQAGMVHPLVECYNRALRIPEVRNGILGEDGNSIGVDHLRDTVVNLRIDMIWTACEDDAVHMMLFHVLERLASLHLDIIAAVLQLVPCGGGCCAHFLLGKRMVDIVRLRKNDPRCCFLCFRALRILTAPAEFLHKSLGRCFQ